MPTHGPGHLPGFDYLGLYRYFLTFCVDSRHQLFTSISPVNLVMRQFEQCAVAEGFAILAYCFMPDHVHFLVEAQAGASDLRRFVTRAKQLSGFYYAKAYGRRLWQRYGYERVLRNDEATLGVIRYIVENPLRAGLVRRVEDFPFWGSGMYTVNEILDAVAWSPRTSG